MLPFQFAIGEDAHDLAACAPRNRHIFQIGFGIVRQNHQRGELVRIDEQRDTLDVVVLRIGSIKRFHNDVLRRDVAHGQGFKEASGDMRILQVSLAVQEIVGKMSVAPSCDLFADAPSFFGMVIPIGEEMAEPLMPPGKFS